MPDKIYVNISYSELKKFYYHARLVMLGGDFGEKDLARLYIAIEYNSLFAEHWYGKFIDVEADHTELLAVHSKITKLLNGYALEHFETSFTRARDMEESDE